MGNPAVYNMPSGTAFLPALARGLKTLYGPDLQDALILLPTRRAVRALGDAFVEEGSASLLPRMRPLADINPEEPPFEPEELAGLVTEPMNPMQRRFEIAKIITHYHKAISALPLDAAGALALADPLIAIMDDAAMEEADLSNMTGLLEMSKLSAEHFQNAITLYEIIQTYWPERLAEIDRMEPFARRVALLNKLTEIWSVTPPDYPVIIAGSTGTLKASARLMACVARMDKGMIVLPGLNDAVPTSIWNTIGPQHPQSSLKTLIETLGVEVGDVSAFPGTKITEAMSARRDIISEALVPVDATGDWPGRIERIRAHEPKGKPQGNEPFTNALDGLSLIEAATNDEEALTIAMIMRETLETQGKTAALVTPDPALARRVKARLRRWNVSVDYSQGEPLEETALGAFLSYILALAQDRFGPSELADVCKHSLTALGQPVGDTAKEWRALEPKYFRGVRKSDRKIAVIELIKKLHKTIAPLIISELINAADWAHHLTSVAELLANTDEDTGAARLWVNDAGEKAAGLLENLIAHGDHLGDMTLPEFARLLATLMRGQVVRPRFGTHPRLSILGPLEARMLTADTIILGGLNEGIWPAVPSLEPFLSRGMRQELGLSLPERRFGLSAHDFAELAANPHVIITRSQRSDEGPLVASRWLWRLQTLLRGALGADADTALAKSNHYLEWARANDYVAPHDVMVTKPPEPRPPVDQRWPMRGDKGGRRLSVTQIKTWVRDPYSMYAKTILGLRSLDDLDMPMGPREYGNAVHNGLENFAKKYKRDMPPDAANKLAAAIEAAMLGTGFETFEISKDRTRTAKIAAKVTQWMTDRRAVGWAVRGIEEKGALYLAAQDFTLSGKPDLVEKGPHGFAVNDYKTGAPASVKVVNAGFDPQLPLTAFMLAEGAFETMGSGPTEELNYLRIKGAGDETLVKSVTPPVRDAIPAMENAEKSIESLRKLIAAYDQKDTAYYSQPRIQYVNDYGDYDHLARRDEWARLGSSGEGV